MSDGETKVIQDVVCCQARQLVSAPQCNVERLSCAGEALAPPSEQVGSQWTETECMHYLSSIDPWTHLI